MKTILLATKKKLHLFALRAALFAVAIPLWLASACTWRLEAWRSRLQTAIHHKEAQR
jgi:hypothetical protein